MAPLNSPVPEPSLPPSRSISRKKKFIFVLLSMALPLLGILCLEGGLRTFGYGGYPPTFKRIGPVEGGTLFVTDTNAAASYFYSSKSRAGAMFENALVMPKPAGSVRILLCGESAMKGFPQPRALACTSFLKSMLEDCWPQRKVEVINLATTAIASFPVLDMLREAIDYAPDLVIVYCGNNEFFGAYGVASLHSSGSTPWAIEMQRRLRASAIVQWLEKFKSVSKPDEDRTLMEIMMGKASIPSEDPLRAAAARNLREHTAEMIRICREHRVPVIVSTLAFNERDLAPLGEQDGGKARACFDQAKSHYVRKEYSEASIEFERAADLDSMPWRPPIASEQAVRDATRDAGGVLCDVQKAFREASPGGCIGWELMDDHVHPSLQGQYVMARAWVECLTKFQGDLAVSPEKYKSLPDWKAYAARLKSNEYEEYGVAHTLRVLCDVPFIRKSNPGAYERFDSRCKDAERRWNPKVVSAAREWQNPKTHSGGIQRPISAMVGVVLLAGGESQTAEPLFDVASRSVPTYSSLHVEYIYFMLAARERNQQKLDKASMELAGDEINRARTLLAHAQSESGRLERFIGRLYQLRHEFKDAIPYLLEAHKKLTGKDRLAADQALVVSYVQTQQANKAREFLLQMIEANDSMAEFYKQLLNQLQTQSATQGGAGT